MNEYIVKNGRKLKIGYTTGTCATAAAKAATRALLTGVFPAQVEVFVPAGKTFSLGILEEQLLPREASCAVCKDGGDDPDVTHGMYIYVSVKKMDRDKESQEDKLRWVIIDGGDGIGRVTKKGLACEVGMAAINPVPRRMIEAAVLEEMEKVDYQGGMEVVVFAPEGAEIAKKTFNGRLGILGGISILGTSGVVEPMSEDAIIETIKIEVNQRNREQILFASPGNYGLDFTRDYYHLDMEQSVKYSNYLGEFLDYAIYCGFKRVLLIGHIGKMIKIGAGIMNTHSKIADGRREIMVAHSAICGVDKAVLEQLMEAVTTDDMHEILMPTGLGERVYKSIARSIQFQLDYRAKGEIEVAFVAFSNQYGYMMGSEKAQIFIEEIKAQVEQ